MVIWYTVGMKENWKSVSTSAGHEISDHGRVKSLARRVPYGAKGATRGVPARILSPFWVSTDRGRQGHLAVELEDGRHKIHILVLEHFVSLRPPGLLGLHRDDNPENNWVGNLYWGTYSDNSFDSVRNGTHPTASKTECTKHHPLDGVYYYKDGTVRQRYCKTCKSDQKRARTERQRQGLPPRSPGRPRKE
jgi:hypothetical protein